MISIQRTRALALAGLIAFFASACQKYEGNKIKSAPASGATVESLAGKDVGTVLAKKYNSAVLTCQLFLVHAAAIPANAKPDDVFTLDLLKATSGPGVVTLKAEKDDVMLTATLKFDELAMFDTTLFGDDGVVYSVKRSPYFTFDFSYEISQKSTGRTLSSIGHEAKGVTERFPEPLIDMSYPLEGDAVGYYDRANCTITTDLKPAYADQFKPIQAK